MGTQSRLHSDREGGQKLQENVFRPTDIDVIGQNPAFLSELEKVPRFARFDATVLITGETGTGKEIVARLIHRLSPRNAKSFVAINCGAIPAELIENELFGHEPGAFSGANESQKGVIFEANEGTLFLDEIDSLPLACQSKLLRLLQENEYRPLGSRKVCKAQIRAIAAANTNLEEAIAEKRFRHDLYFRLNVLRLHLRPLRQRREDIPLLARHFVIKYAKKFDRPARDLTPEAAESLSAYSWPGNVRELENVVERSVLLCEKLVLDSNDLDVPVKSTPKSFRELKAQIVDEFERSYISNLLQQHHGNIGRAAAAARKHRRAFFELMRKHGIKVGQPSPNGTRVDDFARRLDKSVHTVR